MLAALLLSVALAETQAEPAQYVRLTSALAVYREIADGGGWKSVPPGRSLRLGDDNPRVRDLRARLGCEPISLTPPRCTDTGASTLFDEELDALVRHFQSHHGIAVDGIVGPETLRELNVPAADRARQIEINIERWRAMPKDLGDTYIVVNIAAFRLDAIEGGRSVLAMKTVVGKEYTKTPFFASQITEVIVNPWWNVPDSIATKELWPLQRRDPSYFARHHMVVSNGRIRQRPGPWNALGRLKFNIPNRYNVYLHDTPARELFDRPFRASSHGCIRLERPLDLAAYLLRDQPQWTADTITAAIDSDAERTIRLQKPHPVYVLYWTAWVGDDGHIEFNRDPYHRDPP